MAAISAKLPTWYRVLAIVVGLLSIALALVVLWAPALAVWLLIFLLAIALLFIGMDRLAMGISGQPLWYAVPGPIVVSDQPSGTGPTAVPTPKP